MNDGLKKYYQNRFEKYGENPATVQHISKESQFKRFEILFSIAEEITSIIDVGSGLGDLLEYLLDKKYTGKYLGLDFVDEFIEFSNDKYKDITNAKFMKFDFTKDQLPEDYNYLFLSTVFNNKMDNNEEFMLHTIHKMFTACQKGVAFNAMSTYVDYRDEHLYYSNPLKIFDYCKRNLTLQIVLRHDYLVKEDSIPFEYTMYLYK